MKDVCQLCIACVKKELWWRFKLFISCDGRLARINVSQIISYLCLFFDSYLSVRYVYPLLIDKYSSVTYSDNAC